MEINEGDFVSITGPSGSGKSTLLLMLGGMSTPSEGRVTWNGESVFGWKNESRAKWRAEKLGVDIRVIERDILIPEYFEGFNLKIAGLNEKARSFPALFIGDTVLQGEAEIDGSIERIISGADTSKTKQISEAGTAAVNPEELAIIPVAFAGLLDGINPCAFSTLIFLLAYLAYAGRKKREILIIGFFYTITVFIRTT